MDLEQILNEALNEALCIEGKRIKQPNSNKIAGFVMGFMRRKNLKNDSLHSVMPSELEFKASLKLLRELVEYDNGIYPILELEAEKQECISAIYEFLEFHKA